MTLTETAEFTKKAFVVGCIFLFICLLGWLGFQYYYYKIYLPNKKPVEILPELKFGPLPKLELPKSKTSSADYSYTLDTETGSLPNVPADIPKLIKVYPITPVSTDLLALDRAKSLADKLDFKTGPEALSSTEYRFNDKLGGQFTINLENGNFKYNHIESTDSATIRRLPFDEKTQIIQDFKNFLRNKDLIKDQIENGRSDIVFEKTIPADSNFATVSLWQADIDKIPIITPTFKTGLITAIITNSADDLYKYQEINYNYWPIDTENSSTYPLLKPDEAFALLKNGEGSVLIEPQTPKASITKVYLGYYLSEEYLPYLQPVYVFEGPQFVAIVAALSPDQTTTPSNAPASNQ